MKQTFIVNGVDVLQRIETLERENERLKEIIETHNPWHRCKGCKGNYKHILEEIKNVINCSDKNDCDNCPRNNFCEELCDSKENLIYILKTII